MIEHQKNASTGIDGKSSRAKAAAASGKEPRPEPPPDPPPRGTDQARHEAAQKAARQAKALRETVFPSCMASALGLDNQIGPAGYKAYLGQVMKDAGDPKDPIEKMLLEQLAILHHRLGQLHAAAGNAKSLEAAKIYNGATAWLIGEFRRTALALRVYRTPINQEKGLRLARVG